MSGASIPLLAVACGEPSDALGDGVTPVDEPVVTGDATCGWTETVPPACSRTAELWNLGAERAGTISCDTHEDCASTELCGEGTCRNLTTTAVAVCVNGASHRGTHRGDPVHGPTLSSLADLSEQNLEGTQAGFHDLFETNPAVGCEATWEMCRLVTAVDLGDVLIEADELWIDDGGASQRDGLLGSYLGELTPEPQDPRALLNDGCRALVEDGDLSDADDVYQTTVWVSAWFP